ncbi:hypothetical protein B0T24DRAFT_333343 [Lasiosphaeria ovina]|uniref:Uncharacterized protein n=1 Tax=Lasiosphaeria ovina TaxID=92902 RepID=A0AAE0K937_9PEZI|nr:hypothetical protein B0T24DRAFT_333343 [Lasiosphaeria ovina]
MSNIDAQEIFGFIRDNYGESSYDAGQALAFFGQDSVPRWAPPLRDFGAPTGAGDGDASFDSDFDANLDAEYSTTAPSVATTSRTRTTKSSAMSSSSLFSRPRTRYDDASSVGQSLAPTRSIAGHPHRTLVQQLAAGPDYAGHGQPQQQNSFVLWCEFCVLKGCQVTFRGDDEAGWIEHHARHLEDRFPARLMCWFCDHVPFVASQPAERRANFELRMQHIRAHIFDEYQLSDHMRPDFFVIEHLHKHRLLDEETFRYAMQYNELPAEFRLPPEEPSLLPSSRPLGQSQPYDRGQFHDLEKENRYRRRNRDANRRRR